jgi:hypothetical protein
MNHSSKNIYRYYVLLITIILVINFVSFYLWSQGLLPTMALSSQNLALASFFCILLILAVSLLHPVHREHPLGHLPYLFLWLLGCCLAAWSALHWGLFSIFVVLFGCALLSLLLAMVEHLTLKKDHLVARQHCGFLAIELDGIERMQLKRSAIAFLPELISLFAILSFVFGLTTLFKTLQPHNAKVAIRHCIEAIKLPLIEDAKSNTFKLNHFSFDKKKGKWNAVQNKQLTELYTRTIIDEIDEANTAFDFTTVTVEMTPFVFNQAQDCQLLQQRLLNISAFISGFQLTVADNDKKNSHILSTNQQLANIKQQFRLMADFEGLKPDNLNNPIFYLYLDTEPQNQLTVSINKEG